MICGVWNIQLLLVDLSYGIDLFVRSNTYPTTSLIAFAK